MRFEICENEAEQASEIQEKIDYQLICVEDMLKEMEDEQLSVNSSSKSHSVSRESIVRSHQMTMATRMSRNFSLRRVGTIVLSE